VLEDGYLGSGKHLRRALEKHGRSNFRREILAVFDNEEAMNALEREIVTEEFCRREDTYNICEGGKGGWSYIKNSEHWNGYKKGNPFRFQKGNKIWVGKKHSFETKEKISSSNKGRDNGRWMGRKHTLETRQKMSSSHKGRTSPTLGKRWITNGVKNRIICKNLPIPDGWKSGRISPCRD
jgi:group I intron endonuclease